MKFRTENEFTNFKFSDVHVSDIMMSFGTFKICLDNVIIKTDNSKNRDYATDDNAHGRGAANCDLLRGGNRRDHYRCQCDA